MNNVMNFTNLCRLARGVEVLACSNRPVRYSPSSAFRSCAIDCVRASSWHLLAFTRSIEDQMNLSAEKAGARHGTGVRDKHRCTTSMVKNQRGQCGDNPSLLSQIDARYINQMQNRGCAISVLSTMMSHRCMSLAGLGCKVPLVQ
jgi:hypothetical protein